MLMRPQTQCSSMVGEGGVGGAQSGCASRWGEGGLAAQFPIKAVFSLSLAVYGIR